MFTVVRRWLQHKWSQGEERELRYAYQRFAASLDGQLIIKDLIDNFYCTIYEGSDRRLADIHEGKRTIVHYILQRIDEAQRPDKYEVKEESDNVAPVPPTLYRPTG